MDLQEFSASMAQRGCTGNEKTFYGSYKGYPFTVAYVNGKPGGKTVANIYIRFEKNVTFKLNRHFLKTFKPYVKIAQDKNFFNSLFMFGIAGAIGGAVAYSTNQSAGALSLSITTKDSQTFNQIFDSLLEEIARTAPSFGMHIPTTCPLCGTPGCDSYAYINNAYHPTHAVCVQSMTAVTHAKANQNQIEGSYLLGAIGAILGAIVGHIPNIIALTVFNYTISALFALIPLASYYGYKLFRGKMTGVGTLLISIFSILSSPITDLGSIYFYLLAEGYRATVGDLFSLMFEPEILGSMAISFLFTIFGLFIVFGIIRRGNNAHVVKDSLITHSTLRPMEHLQQAMPPVAQPAPVYVPAPSQEQQNNF